MTAPIDSRAAPAPAGAQAPVTLLLVDDHRLFRRGLIALLAQDPGLAVLGEAGDASEALALAAQLQPQVILLDNHLPGCSGVDAIAGLRAAAPAARVLMLTVSEDAQDLTRALRNGAQGYLLKTMDGDLLAQAIRSAARGEPVLSPDLTGTLVAAFQAQGAGAAGAPLASGAGAAPQPASATTAPLSAREQQVLREIARGASNKQIARSLEIAETTVKIHVRNILRKLSLRSRVQAAVYAADPRRAQ